MTSVFLLCEPEDLQFCRPNFKSPDPEDLAIVELDSLFFGSPEPDFWILCLSEEES